MIVTMKIKFTPYLGEEKVVYEDVETNNVPMVGDCVAHGAYGVLTVTGRLFFLGNLKGLVQKGEDRVTLFLERK